MSEQHVPNILKFQRPLLLFRFAFEEPKYTVYSNRICNVVLTGHNELMSL